MFAYMLGLLVGFKYVRIYFLTATFWCIIDCSMVFSIMRHIKTELVTE